MGVNRVVCNRRWLVHEQPTPHGVLTECYEYVVVCYLFLSWRGISESTMVVVEVMVEYNIDDSDKPPSSLFGNSRVNKA